MQTCDRCEVTLTEETGKYEIDEEVYCSRCADKVISDEYNYYIIGEVGEDI